MMVVVVMVVVVIVMVVVMAAAFCRIKLEHRESSRTNDEYRGTIGKAKRQEDHLMRTMVLQGSEHVLKII
jgi:hypothetical protein